MSDNRHSLFVSTNGVPTSCATSIEQFEQQFYPTHMSLPELQNYPPVDYNFYLTGELPGNMAAEQYYDRHDCITPLSSRSFVDQPSSASDAPAPSPLHASLELPTGIPTHSPAAFMTPTWTPEPMARFEDHATLSTPVTSPRSVHQYSGSNASTITISAPPQRVFQAIAPSPAPATHRHSLKRSMSRDDEAPSTPGPKRKRSMSPSAINAELNAEDELLLRLKDEENLSWKEIQNRFHTDLNKMFQIPALQMRLKRLRERMREWTETDVQALRMAYEYWNDSKFEIIAAKMSEYGANEKWSAKQCFKKWHEIAPQADLFRPQQFQSTPTPTFTPIPFQATFVHGTPDPYHPFVTTSA